MRVRLPNGLFSNDRSFLELIAGSGVTLTATEKTGRDDAVSVTVGAITPGATGRFNIKDYGAVGDGVTNDTAAIQAALDAAAPVFGSVYIPASTNNFMFSNLKLPPYVLVFGDGMSSSHLMRIVGSTGSAVREKTVGEGNAFGATGIRLRDFTLDGNSTVGDGFNLGNQTVNFQFTSQAWIQDVYALNFPSGNGFNLNSNAAFFKHLWAFQCQTGINFQGGGANFVYGVFSERNSLYQLHVQEAWDFFYGVQLEDDTASGANPYMRLTGSNNSVNGIFINHNNVTAKTSLVENITGSNANTFRDLVVTGAGTFTHGIRHGAWGVGSGTDHFVSEFVNGLGSDQSSWYLNDSTGLLAKRAGNTFQTISLVQSVVGLTYGATVATDASLGNVFRITATNTTPFTISNPTNPQSGMVISYEINNGSGGVMGAITWGAAFRLAGAFTNPANAKRRVITFYYEGAAWSELSRSAADS